MTPPLQLLTILSSNAKRNRNDWLRSVDRKKTHFFLLGCEAGNGDCLAGGAAQQAGGRPSGAALGCLVHPAKLYHQRTHFSPQTH